MEQREEKNFTLKDVLYVLTKNWLIEIIILAVALCAGLYIALTNSDVYVARSSIIVKANINNINPSYSDTSLSKYYIPTVSKLVKEDIVIERARSESGLNIFGNSIGVTYDEESFIINISYSDMTAKNAKEKLNAIVAAVKSVVTETEDDSALKQALEVAEEYLNDPSISEEEKERWSALYNAAEAAYNQIGNGNAKSKYFPATIEVRSLKTDPEVARVNSDLRIMLISGLIGFVLAIGVSVLLYFIADKVVSVEVLENITGKKNFLCVPGKRKKNEYQKTLKTIDVSQLSDTLIYMNGEGKSVVYQTQSTTHSEGKSTVTANLAISLGRSNRKTLIIDCDFNKMQMHRLFGVERHTGITDYFKGDSDFDGIIKHTQYENVDLITCGDVIDNHTIFFASPKFAKLIEEAKERYEFVLIDCAPVGIMSDYINISKHVDGTILVVSCNSIKSVALKETVKELNHCDAKMIGTVFNFCNGIAGKYYNYYNDYKYYQKMYANNSENNKETD